MSIGTPSINTLQKILLVCMAYLLPFCASGQIEVSNAIDLGYPLLTNSYNAKINYGQLYAGLRFGVSYKPQNTQFFPTLYFAFGRTKLPLKQYEDNVLGLNANYLNLLLNGNFVMVTGDKGNTIYAIGGIGFTKFGPKGLYIAGKNSGEQKYHLDSSANVDKVFPAMELGLEYVYGGSVNSNLYISMGINVEYVYFFPDRNNYYASVTDAQGNDLLLRGALQGHAIIPTFSMSLHYLMGKNLIFWQKKKSHMYL